VRLDPRSPRPGPPDRCRLPRPSRRRAPPGRGRGRGSRRRPGLQPAAAGIRAAGEGVTTMADTDLVILRDGDNVGVLTSDRPGIARGHEVALVDIEPGTQIRKYGQSIGV